METKSQETVMSAPPRRLCSQSPAQDSQVEIKEGRGSVERPKGKPRSCPRSALGSPFGPREDRPNPTSPGSVHPAINKPLECTRAAAPRSVH